MKRFTKWLFGVEWDFKEAMNELGLMYIWTLNGVMALVLISNYLNSL